LSYTVLSQVNWVEGLNGLLGETTLQFNDKRGSYTAYFTSH